MFVLLDVKDTTQDVKKLFVGFLSACDVRRLRSKSAWDDAPIMMAG